MKPKLEIYRPEVVKIIRKKKPPIGYRKAKELLADMKTRGVIPCLRR